MKSRGVDKDIQRKALRELEYVATEEINGNVNFAQNGVFN